MGTVTPLFRQQSTDENDSTHLKQHYASDDVIFRISETDHSIINRLISTEELYPLSSEIRPELARAFELINEGVAYLSNAITMLDEGDLLSSDDYINRLQALLPEIFCCRSIGDGFGEIINAVFHSIANKQGAPLNNTELQAIKNILKRISTEPFISTEDAVDEIIKIEEVGFEVEPSHFKFLADMLDD